MCGLFICVFDAYILRNVQRALFFPFKKCVLRKNLNAEMKWVILQEKLFFF